MPWLDGYTRNTPTGRTGRTPDDPRRVLTAPARICIHTTEGAWLPDYSWPPHITVGYVGPQSLRLYSGYKPGEVKKWQHVPTENTSYALRASPDVETNHMGAFNIQIEVITYSAGTNGNRGAWPPALFDAVAGVLADLIDAHPELEACLDNYPEQWAPHWSAAQWVDPYGGKPFLYGHRQAPAPNTHSDPAGLRFDTLVKKVRARLIVRRFWRRVAGLLRPWRRRSGGPGRPAPR